MVPPNLFCPQILVLFGQFISIWGFTKKKGNQAGRWSRGVLKEERWVENNYVAQVFTDSVVIYSEEWMFENIEQWKRPLHTSLKGQTSFKKVTPTNLKG